MSMRPVSAHPLKILFAFENPLPSTEADAEVFVTTARYLASAFKQTWFHVPASRHADYNAIAVLTGMPVVRAIAPVRSAALRHLLCGLTLVFRKQFRNADLIYTRNLWIAWIAVKFGRRVVFDHYRPWPDQIPPLQLWIYRLMCNRRFLINICHSEYTRQKYLALGIPPDKLVCVHNGFEPRRFRSPLSLENAKQAIGVSPATKTVVYTGRINRKKGLSLILEAAKRLPDILFILVGSYGDGPIETVAKDIPNIRIVPWQPEEAVSRYVFAADILLIPPSSQPLAEFGSTVLPLKLFSYMASGRPILAGDTPDLREILKHEENAFLCSADSLESLTAGIRTLIDDAGLAERLARQALAQSRDFTWEARARTIAAIIENRLCSVPERSGTWSRAQSRNWLRQSRRWLIYLIWRRSWILPPTSPSTAGAPQA
ncbi:MAG: glycosyltransferase family 4 protein [Proteobacteria bacterium]|nr:glycosyltransferase family 4 protein [Pseudomonadota bacterium]